MEDILYQTRKMQDKKSQIMAALLLDFLEDMDAVGFTVVSTTSNMIPILPISPNLWRFAIYNIWTEKQISHLKKRVQQNTQRYWHRGENPWLVGLEVNDSRFEKVASLSLA